MVLSILEGGQRLLINLLTLATLAFFCVVSQPITEARADPLIISDHEDGWLNVRRGPGASYAILAQLDNGHFVEEVRSNGRWSLVRYIPSGDWRDAEGWVYTPRTMTLDQFSTIINNAISTTARPPFDSQLIDTLYSMCRSTQTGVGLRVPVNLSQICREAFSCADGGCVPHMIVAAVRPGRDRDFRSVAAQMLTTEVAPCDANQIGWLQATASSRVAPGNLFMCITSVPGFEEDNVLLARAFPTVISAAWRAPAGAGSLPVALMVTPSQYRQYRGQGAASLSNVVVGAVEQILGQRCTSNDQFSCSIYASNGRVRVQITGFGHALTGRPDHWGQVYMEVYPFSAGTAPEYGLGRQVYLEMPITSLRRWPYAQGIPPQAGFQAVNFDPGFNAFRDNVISELARALGGRVVRND